MGIYSPIIRLAQGRHKSHSEHAASKRLLTVPTIITGTRVPLAIKASERILRGEKYATPWVLMMGISDMEGIPARLMDKNFPKMELGSSEFGSNADTAADALAAFILASSILFGPNISKSAKVGTALILGKEGVKAAQYAHHDKNFRLSLAHAELPDKHLELPVTLLGKEAMVEALIALGCAAATNDFENPFVRSSLGALTFVHATAAVHHGNQNQSAYDQQAELMIRDIQLQEIYPR